jgi:hypothetical protein
LDAHTEGGAGVTAGARFGPDLRSHRKVPENGAITGAGGIRPTLRKVAQMLPKNLFLPSLFCTTLHLLSCFKTLTIN